jgi:hypothetical protein
LESQWSNKSGACRPLQDRVPDLRHFYNGLERTVEDFYHWAYGDVFTNTIRAAIAEYLVACALDLDHGRRSS